MGSNTFLIIIKPMGFWLYLNKLRYGELGFGKKT